LFRFPGGLDYIQGSGFSQQRGKDHKRT
jgi:hypothetical protein